MHDKNRITVYYSHSLADFFQYQPLYWTVLDREERAVALRFKTPLLQQRYIAAHGLLRGLLAAYINCSAASLCFIKTAYGKPFLSDYPTVGFNLSHSGNGFVLAISDACQLGVDLEYYKPRTAWQGLVNKCFADEEAVAWYALPVDKREQAFYQYWVKKEAFVKAVGRGIAVGLKQCVIDDKNQERFLRVPLEYGNSTQWKIDSVLFDNAIIAVVSNQHNRYLHSELLVTSMTYIA